MYIHEHNYVMRAVTTFSKYNSIIITSSEDLKSRIYGVNIFFSSITSFDFFAYITVDIAIILTLS